MRIRNASAACCQTTPFPSIHNRCNRPASPSASLQTAGLGPSQDRHASWFRGGGHRCSRSMNLRDSTPRSIPVSDPMPLVCSNSSASSPLDRSASRPGIRRRPTRTIDRVRAVRQPFPRRYNPICASNPSLAIPARTSPSPALTIPGTFSQKIARAPHSSAMRSTSGQSHRGSSRPRRFPATLTG